jgi:hypothetical protein
VRIWFAPGIEVGIESAKDDPVLDKNPMAPHAKMLAVKNKGAMRKLTFIV